MHNLRQHETQIEVANQMRQQKLALVDLRQEHHFNTLL